MPDRKEVITHLQIIHTWAEFARERGMCFSDTHLVNIAQWINDAITMLKEQPEIVWCKDCKYFDGLDCMVNEITNIMDTDWFCADGERRDDNA